MKGGFSVLFSACFISVALAQGPQYKVCATDKHSSQCSRLQRGNSEVICQWVQDSIECAKRIQNGTANFGVFSAESALQLSVLNWSGMTVVKQLKHRERRNAYADFESVAIIRKDIQGGFDGLRGKQFCHPGLNYGRNQRWSEGFLKHFERLATPAECDAEKSPAEIEVATLSKFFGSSCRPGVWSHDIKEDAMLKSKYSSLCKLCDSFCKYDEKSALSGPDRSHQNALNCLKNGGDVTYVSREDADYFFQKEGQSSEFRYLCPNGTIEQIVNNKTPCIWLSQPWKIIISASENPVFFSRRIDDWIKASQSSSSGWESALAEILDADSHVVTDVTTLQQPSEYVRQYRAIPIANPYCNSEVSWCTKDEEEVEKCEVIRAGGISNGVYPVLVCNKPSGNTVNCLDDISKSNAEFMGIDSNFGYLARKLYNLTSAMYFETEMDQYSSTVVVVHDNSKYKKFEDLRGSEACIPEFGSTSSLAFVNLGKQKKFFKKNECRYGRLLENFFGDSCAPGAQDIKHAFTAATGPTSLCSACLRTTLRRPYGSDNNEYTSNNTNTDPTCAAEETNRYYGNQGALRCLQEQGDVAILELQSLKDHAKNLTLDENKFRIICRNGSLASYTGFDVDTNCALTTIVDGEIVVRRGSKRVNSIVNVLNALDTYFQSDPEFKMFNIFNGQRHLLFKDSTLGLIAANEDNHGSSVQNYISLFQDIEKCVQKNSATKASLTLFTAIIFAFFTKLFTQ